MWTTSLDLLDTIHDAHRRLKTKETDAIQAHAEARLLGAATRILAVSLEHARLTNRLKEGSSELPLMTITTADHVGIESGDAGPVIEAQAQSALAS